MAQVVSIKISCRIEQAEADGSKCLCCGDEVYLGAFILAIYMGKVSGREKRIGRAKGMLCGSCGEELENRRSER